MKKQQPVVRSPNRRLRVLTVDDEPNILSAIVECMEAEGHMVSAASSAGEALQFAGRSAHQVALIDLRLRDSSGLDLIPALLDLNPGIAIVVITAYATVETAVEAIRLGAIDYLPKPFSPEQVRLVVRKAVERRELQNRVEVLEEQLQSAVPVAMLQSANARMADLLGVARKVAARDATVLLTGESGTGKGIVAQAIHTWSERRGAPFVVVHCPSLPADLFESELFGHVKGAFTGAVGANPGRVSAAEGGTLFLDEVGDLPLALQPKLLRFLQERTYERVGNPTSLHADVRIVAATNQDLLTAIEEGSFREDLFYRLNVIALEVPPLRHRTEDILQLANEFVRFFALRYNRNVVGLTREAERALLSHGWPGNVRELQNLIEREVILSNSDRLDFETIRSQSLEVAIGPQVGDMVSLRELESEHIRRVVHAASSLDEAAQILGIDPATLWRKRKSLDQ